MWVKHANFTEYAGGKARNGLRIYTQAQDAGTGACADGTLLGDLGEKRAGNACG